MRKSIITKMLVQWLILIMIFQNTVYATNISDMCEPVMTENFIKEDIEEAVSENMATKVSWYLGDKSPSKTHGAVGSIAGNDLRLYALNGFGKIIPNTKDSKVFYYTPIPADKNFTLTCNVHVNDWTFYNGQEGFGIMAADKVSNTDSFWNNSVDAIITRCSYAAPTGGTVDLGLGPCALVRYGVTNENVAELDSDTDSQAAINKYFNKYQYALYDGISTKGFYNLVANTVQNHDFDISRSGVYDAVLNPTGYEPQVLENTIENPISDYRLTIQKNNSGYFVSYTDEKGKTTTRKFYYCGNDFLTSLVNDTVYVGFFAARSVDVTFSDVDLRIVDPLMDTPAEEIEKTIYNLSAYFSSNNYCNIEDYELCYHTNWDGKLKITDESGKVIFEDYVKAEKDSVCSVKLDIGTNQFTAYFEPDAEYHYGYDIYHPANKYNVLSSYKTKVSKFNVTRNTYEKRGDKIYVAPSGTSFADGTKSQPMDLQAACKYVQPGQTIIMLPGIYKFNSGVTIPRGINGKKGEPITLMGDPDSSERPVIDFSKTGEGIIFAGNYWYYKGFDVTGSLNGKKGMAIAGSYVVAEDIHTYRNGNTGLQVTKLKSSDTKDDYWPHDILIKNCLSYENADAGYEDADGFAAKIFVGENIVFDGCVAHHNSDDGWDLYAKKESGCIGAVTIRNCVAYSNGFIHDKDGNLIIAGNGNGFKLGGESLSGKHTLLNSYSFMNKAIGIDANSCPDIKVSNCVSYDNKGANVALYTSALTTDYHMNKVVSLRVDNNYKKNDSYVVKNQSQTDVFNNTTFYWRNTNSANRAGAVFDNSYVKSFAFDPEKDEIKRCADGSIDLGDFLQFNVSEVGGVDISSVKFTEQMSATEIFNREAGPMPTPTPTPTATPMPTTAAPTPTVEPTLMPTATVPVLEQSSGTGRKVKLSQQMLESYNDVSLVNVISKDKNGKEYCILEICPKDFTLGNEFYLFKTDSDKSVFGAVNKKKYKVSKKGIVVSVKEGGKYILVPKVRAKEICQEIENGILLTVDKTNIQAGEKAFFDVIDKSGLDSVKKIQYKSLNKKVAVVNRYGRLIAKETGSVIIEAKIVLKNGTYITKKVQLMITDSY